MATPAAAQDRRAEPAQAQLLVEYAPGSAADAADAERAAGARLTDTIRPLGVHVVEVPADLAAEAAADLGRDPSVLTVARDRPVRAVGLVPNDEWWASQWAPVRTSAPQAWALGTGSPSIVVAVIDTGVDFGHPDLSGKFVAGYDTVNGDTNPSDDQGHGTAVAGVVGALSNNAVGVASFCPQCSLMPVKVLGADGTGTIADVASGIVWATDRGARVINLSLGTPSSVNVLESAVQYARNRGVVVIAAAGNDGTTAPFYPAAYPGVVSVAASNESDGLYSWSNRGSWVSVAAPGSNLTTNIGSTYTSFYGTSSAAPVVAGIAGLALSGAPTATAAQVEQELKATAVAIPGVAHGRVDAYRTVGAVKAAVGAPAPEADPEPAPAADPVRSVFRSAVGPLTTTRRFTVDVGARTVSARVGSRATGVRFTLSVRNSSGVVVALKSGRRYVRLDTTLRPGRYRYVVRARTTRRVSFTLAVAQQ